MTFAEVACAYEVIDKFSKDPLISKYDIRFGGRRKFCKQSYADLGKKIKLCFENFDIIIKNFNRFTRRKGIRRKSEVNEEPVVRRPPKFGQKENISEKITNGNLNRFFITK